MKTKQIKEFTDKGIKGYKAKSDRYDVRETAGLRLRVHPKGSHVDDVKTKNGKTKLDVQPTIIASNLWKKNGCKG